MLVDFHMHSTASDGELAPAELLARAQALGIGALAITDHDTLGGYLQVQTPRPGASAPQLYPGVELSCQWAGCSIHVLGLGVCPRDPVLARGLSRLASARLERGEIIGRRLAAAGYEGAFAGAAALAGDSQLGRPHFASWLVAQGHVPDAGTAFDRYLGRNRIGDVKACWPPLAEVTGWICAAGGIAVLAHPLKYRFTAMKLGRLLADFIEAGGRGLEVLSGRQETGQTAQLMRLADRHGLLLSAGSDFHRDAPYGPTLGVESAAFDGRPTVWQALASARQAAPGAPESVRAPG